MTRRLISIRGGISIAVALVAATTMLWIATSARTTNNPATMVWDEKASKELAAALHYTHEVANAGDIKALKQLMIGDDALVTFELASDQRTPVPLRSKKEIDQHLDAVNQGVSSAGTLSLDMPKMNCRATATFGVCTEECTVRLKKADGTEQIDHFFGTGTAVKLDGQGKWLHWHMSGGGDREIVKGGKASTATSHH